MLIIEDEPIIAMDIETIVRDLGHSVTGVAVTRDEAVAQALARRPGLVLADIQLADDSSGIDAVKDILAEFQVPVIFITAFPERLLTGERPEPTFLITKPFQRSTVKAAISPGPVLRHRDRPGLNAELRRFGTGSSAGVAWLKRVGRSTMDEDRTHHRHDAGAGGATPHMTRYILPISLVLVIIIFVLIVADSGR